MIRIRRSPKSVQSFRREGLTNQGTTKSDDDDSAFDGVECFHDFCLVWPFEIRARLADRESNSNFMVDRIAGILSGGPGESVWLLSILGIPTEDHSRSDHAGRLHRLCDSDSQRETPGELSCCLRLPWRGRIFCVRVQGPLAQQRICSRREIASDEIIAGSNSLECPIKDKEQMPQD